MILQKSSIFDLHDDGPVVYSVSSIFESIFSCLVSHIQSLVFGGVDGIITSFAVVAAIAGAGYSTFYILAIGIANLIADGLSMGNCILNYFC